MLAVRWFASAVAIATMTALIPGVMGQVDPAAYAELEFTVVVTDAQDHVGFLDIREVAIGEPGDGTLVARFRVQDFGLNAGTETFHFFMSTPAGSFRAGFNTAGEPATHSSSSGGFESCAVDGSTVYCVMPYEAIEAEVGTTLTGTYVITYQQAAQDFAPGGYFESSVLGNTGDDYTITGGSGAATAVAETIELTGNLTKEIEGSGLARFDVEVTNAGVDNATVNLTVADAPGNVTVANATGNLTLELEKNATTVGPNATAVIGATVDVPEGTPPGDYSWSVLAEGVNGGNASIAITLKVLPPAAAPFGANETATEEGNATATADDGALIPGPAAPLVAIGFAAAAIWSRRRRQ